MSESRWLAGGIGTILALALALAGGPIENGDFEETGTKGDPVPGWTIEIGARNGAETPPSTVEIDRGESHSGKRSLHFRGSSETRGWRIAKQALPVRPGGRYVLTGWTKTAGVVREGIQFDNCYLMLILMDGAGQMVARDLRVPGQPDSGWTEQRLAVEAPDGAREAWIYAFLSKTGELWVDDLELSIEGGEKLPEFETVFEEDFAKARRLTSKWKKEVGATNGAGGTENRIEIDRESGAPGSPGSLHLSGDADTRTWRALRRELRAKPGEIFRLSAMVRAKDLRREGIQFENFHLHLFFVDRRGETLGAVRFAHPGLGTYGWKPVTVEAVAPLETKKVRMGVFLSVSGDAWIDDLVLASEPGGDPPYADFVELRQDGLTLHYSENDPQAGGARAYLQRLVEAKAAICSALEVEWKDPVDVYVYANEEVGRRLTGSDLDFADPSGRKVHQRWNSYIAHELVHVIAHNSLQEARTGLLGEGLAVWLDGQPGVEHHRAAARLLGAGELPRLADLLSDFRGQKNAYPAAGSFCGWLIEAHGLEAFEAMYPLADPSAKSMELLGRRLEDFEADWHAAITGLE